MKAPVLEKSIEIRLPRGSEVLYTYTPTTPPTLIIRTRKSYVKIDLVSATIMEMRAGDEKEKALFNRIIHMFRTPPLA